MDIIFTQPFVVVERRMERTGQRTIEEEHAIELYEDRIRAGQEDFALKDVFDVSYRFTSALYGFLYLHTNRGVVSYIIKKDPSLFVEEYKKLVH
ncbi:hypothetical protein [Pseudalkalibacillus hwajinpoensis]|uniref:Uncharacterized protein n=1 Tax=Guptibacillus hwajinpoensis TaxID=208199 RepID=A0A4U1MN16_9BACL|nr:hypothetical protein [Pseudalkalibacillus hwajinpoensis]TKD72065.1 hypothetical protein FBF83_04500 [Pseudalkalibacillus hwajinpoensis]